jgi:hypothetical protein
MGLIRRIEISEDKVMVRCLQSGIEFRVEFAADEVEHIDYYPSRHLTLDELQEELDECRGRGNQAIELFGVEFEDLEMLYRELLDDLEEIMMVNGIYSDFNFNLLLARHYLGQMV